MNLFDVIAILISVAALFSYVNHRFVGLPSTIGQMLVAMAVSLAMVALGHFRPGLEGIWMSILAEIDFNRALMGGMLGFLLFAGALHVDINDLYEQRLRVLTFATVGVALSTLIIGSLMYIALGLVGLGLPYVYCLLFGAIVSPTDPIAVLGILKKAGAPRSLEIKITGESLFNDGVGVVVFTALLAMASGSHGAHGASIGELSLLFGREALGGAAFGLALGGVGYAMLKSIEDYQVEILVTLALVTGGYALAMAVHTSGPIAMVVAGLLIGNHGRKFAMSERTRERLDTFWQLVDELLNSVLFVLIGLEILVVNLTGGYLAAGLMAVPVALLARFASIGVPYSILSLRRRFTPGALKVLTWGGLRGGISVALALSLPAGPERDLILSMTYVVVVFSILVQGLTVKRLIQRVVRREAQSRTPMDCSTGF